MPDLDWAEMTAAAFIDAKLKGFYWGNGPPSSQGDGGRWNMTASRVYKISVDFIGKEGSTWLRQISPIFPAPAG